jgi:arylsulfatase A-like enzyme
MKHLKNAEACLAFGLLVAIAVTTATAAEKPNFVIVIGDDHGFYHSSVYGSPEFKTPNMQALADEGMHLTNVYVASPSCAPSRAALFTRRMPYRNGIVGNYKTRPVGEFETALYDLESDPSETTDVSGQHPEIVARLKVEAEKRDAEIKENARPIGTLPSGA